MTDIQLHIVSETPSVITVGWTPPPGQEGYAVLIDGAEKANDGKRHASIDRAAATARIGKMPGETTPASKHTYGIRTFAPGPEGSVPTPPAVWPTSFTSGPLGLLTPLPKNPGDPFVVDYPGIVDGTWAQTQQMIQAREAAIGRKFHGIQTDLYYNRGSLAPNELGEHRLEWINGRGQVVCVSVHVEYSIAETNAGAADPTWAAVADYLKALGFPVMMRMWWEFNNDSGFAWSVGNSPNIGAPFVTAWKRVVNIFKQHGVENVGFWWCPMEGGDRVGQEQSYPGDAYVDWVGSDVYSSCYAGTQCWEGYAGPGWASFAQLALYQGQPHECALDLYGGRKAFVWGEVGCVIDPAHTDLKAAWFPALAGSIKSSGACGISFFDQDVSKFEGPKANWRVDAPTSDPSVMAGFVQMAHTLS